MQPPSGAPVYADTRVSTVGHVRGKGREKNPAHLSSAPDRRT